MLWSEFGPASSGGWGWLLGALRLGRDGKAQLAMVGAGWRRVRADRIWMVGLLGTWDGEWGLGFEQGRDYRRAVA